MHVFYADLRTRTYAFSRREGDRTEYWLAHGDDAPTSLGTETGLPTEPFSSYAGSRYGYEGDYRNLGTNAESNRQVERNGALVPFGRWPKVNPILGRYETQAYNFQFSVSPPPTFGIDVAVDGSVLASGVLPGGATFNYHSRVDLEQKLEMPLADTTLLPIGVR